MGQELLHASTRYPALGVHRRARVMMGQVASSMVGQYYLKGAKGARPGQCGGAPPR